MDVLTGPLPSLSSKLAALLVGDYNLQKGDKNDVRLLQKELEGMDDIVKHISNIPEDQLNVEDDYWSRVWGHISYDIDDAIDKLMVGYKGMPANQWSNHRYNINSLTKWSAILSSLNHMFSSDISSLRNRAKEVAKRREQYMISTDVEESVMNNPRSLGQHNMVTEYVGINLATEAIINRFLTEHNEASDQKDKILSIVGLGGMGKTTLANAVYQKCRAEFDCSAFVSVTQTPDMAKLFKDLFYQLAKKSDSSINNYIDDLREFLENKRYFIVIDDLWDVSVWTKIKCALPHNSVGGRIITTTRNFHVAQQVTGDICKLEPLSCSDSRKLLYGRIFGNDSSEDTEKYLDELAEVTDRILKKCAGMPIAIITIASLLACKRRTKMEWYNVYNSIGFGLEDNPDVNNMREILALSYYALPSHLRSCLLFLSMFPEDYEIDKDNLIWMWIAEGFIQHVKGGNTLFEQGENYFNGLINRSMIEPVHKRWYHDTTEYYCISAMVLDVIRSLSTRENFVSILNQFHGTPQTEKVRRLSLQDGNLDHGTYQASVSTQQVRSVIAFPSTVHLVPALLSFKLLRVLELQDCCFSQGYSLEYLGNLFLLRYLGLGGTGIHHLPEDIGNLKFLQTLITTGSEISSLPSNIFHLKCLMCLQTDGWTRVPNGIGGLTSIEELSTFCIRDSKDIKELSHLSELRVLSIDCRTGWNIDSLARLLVEFLQKLQKIQSLSISAFGGCNLDAWVPPQHLRKLQLTGCWSFPSCMNPSVLLDLSFISIELTKLQQENLEIIGRLPNLSYLDLEVDHDDFIGRYVIGAHWFPSLVHCVLRGSIGLVEFRQEAMPKLRDLCMMLPVPEKRETADCNGDFDLGLENLKSLQHVTISFLYGGASEEDGEKAEAALKHAMDIHPNRPTLQIL